MEVPLQPLGLLGADFDRRKTVGRYFSQDHAGYYIYIIANGKS